ncbi:MULTISPECIES: MFS transporter [unclassified Myxococcus]|uniref:MFS transporter n=1 Tax=unclassified Myxococcus TaxID=2648731 RepID=UPI00157AD838|nr:MULTISPECIES: MFS transporter [unclassified Myxococcus]NTX04442.1 MFS transporter [Myxococcus sp. CA040A]NTX12942.1 MFS transporter [Myxococcus sp. CA056]NTX36608.1 MFS transporter [Myxococcus sp. CA033]
MTAPSPASPSRPLLTFGLVWLGQFVSLFGSGLTSFALGAHVYQLTGSTTRFVLISFFATLPLAVLSPFAGVLVDRWDRRKAMLWSDVGSGLTTALIWLLLVADDLGQLAFKAWYLYPIVLLGGCCNAFRWPAWTATTPLLIPKQHLGRASGMAELGGAISQIASPLFAGLLVGSIGLHGVLFMDVVSFLFAAGVLVVVRFPSAPGASVRRAGPRSMRAELAEGWRFVRDRPGLSYILAFSTFTNSSLALVLLLFTPLVLAFTDLKHLGLIGSISGMGLLAGGILTSVWGGPRRRILGIAGFPIIASVMLLLAALPPSVPLLATAAALFLFSMPLTTTNSHVIWQLKVPLEIQGRVSALRKTVGQSGVLLTTLIAGPLADRVFEPWMAPGGAFAGSVGRVLGTGTGRGIAFLFVVLGFAVLGAVGLLLLSPRARRVQEELPDMIPSHPLATSLPSEQPPAGAVPESPLSATGNTPS